MQTPEAQPPPNELSPADLEILKVRTKYAWDWWEFHGRQRMIMFNYFLLVTGVLVNGYLLALKEKFEGVPAAICSLGVLQCVSFFMIDIRNRKMLYYAADLLKWLEEEYLFQWGSSRGRGPIVRATTEDSSDLWLHRSKMMYWIRLTYVVVALGFLISLADSIWLLCNHKHLFS